MWAVVGVPRENPIFQVGDHHTLLWIYKHCWMWGSNLGPSGKKQVHYSLCYWDIQDELEIIEVVIISKCLLLEKDTRIKDCKWKRNLHWKVKVQGHCKHFTLCFFDFSGKVWTTLDRGEQNKTMHLTKILRRFDLTLTSNFHYHTQASLG